jgi:fructose transport system ATP-binding protein
MKSEAQREMAELKFRLPSIGSAVEDLSGGQRQGVAVARAGIFARRLVIMDEPTAALGVRESGEVLNLIRTIRDRGLPVLLISHNMPHVFELADRIHIMRLGRRVALTTPKENSMGEVVAIMTGAMPGNEQAPGADTVK